MPGTAPRIAVATAHSGSVVGYSEIIQKLALSIRSRLRIVFVSGCADVIFFCHLSGSSEIDISTEKR